MSDFAIEFEEPPALTKGSGRAAIDWPGILQPLLSHPGKWAKIRHYTSDSGASSNAKKLRQTMGEHWETTSRRTNGKGEGSDLYVRYLKPKAARA